jgi:hypothetical protein
MAHIPDEIVNHSAKGNQTFWFWVAALIALGGVTAIANGAVAGFLLLLIAYGIGWAASKIKTTYTLRGKGGVYE